MSTTVVRRTWLTFAIGLLLVVTACGQEAPLIRRGVLGHAAVTHVGGMEPQNEVDTDTDIDEPGALRSPHLDLQLTGHTVTDEVTAKQATAFGYAGGPVEITEGNEFVLAFMAQDGTSSDGVEASVRVEDETIELDRAPAPGEGVAAVAPEGADVWLDVTDEGETQSLNLRDGTRGDSIDGYYNAKSSASDLDDYEEKGQATAQAGEEFRPETRSVTLSMTVQEAQRSPWIEDRGWADDGNVWVGVEVGDIMTDSVWGFDTDEDSHEPIINWKLDIDELFALMHGDGKAAEPYGDATLTADDSRNPIDAESGDMEFDPSNATLVFQVPDDTVDAQLRITPEGTLEAKWADATGSSYWNDPPAEGDIDIGF